MPSERSENLEVRTVNLSFRSESLALYDDRMGPRLDISPLGDELTRDTIDFLRVMVESAEDEDCTELLRIVGRQLFEFVFGNGSRPPGGDAQNDPLRAYRRIQERFAWARESTDRLLHLRLDFEPAAAELAKWPWEFLYYPAGDTGWQGYFVAEKRVVILREIRTSGNVKEGEPPLKVLLAISEPESGRADVHAEEMAAILRAHQEATPRRIELKVERNLKFGELKKAIEDVRPDIFHFHGHGDDEGGVYFPRSPRRRVYELDRSTPRFSSAPPENGVGTPGSTIAALFQDHRPQLVVFTACRTAAQEVAFADVAQSLANEGIPLVVAMQFRVSVESAERFGERFYNALLANRESIEPAFADALAGLAETSAEQTGRLASRTVGTPVLFVNQTGGRLLTPSTGNGSGSGTADRDRVRCVFCGAAGSIVKFCGDCGLPPTCQGCGFRHPKWTRFCMQCAAELPPKPAPQPPVAGGAQPVSGGDMPRRRDIGIQDEP